MRIYPKIHISTFFHILAEISSKNRPTSTAEVSEEIFQGPVERIPAIASVVSVSSEAFKTMFNGSFEPPTEIEVPDADPDAFRTVLR